MIAEPRPNTISRPYRGLSVQEPGIRLRREAITEWLLGREVYRRTEYLALRDGTDTALVQVAKDSDDLFSPATEVRVLALPDRTRWIDAPAVDVGNATALAATALSTKAGLDDGVFAYVVQGRHEHVNFIWRPAPIDIRVTEVVPPQPAKLVSMAEQVVAFDEDLPPLRLRTDAIDLTTLTARHPAPRYLLPCRGAGTELDAPTDYLDTRPPRRQDWLLLGCARSSQFHRHFYDDEPATVDICPRQRPATGTPTLTKCCLLERGVEVDGQTAVVPWGANLDEVRSALRSLAGLGEPERPVGRAS